jgi:hypothetical protein
LPSEFTEFANSQMAKLNAAYDQICLDRESSRNSEKMQQSEAVKVSQ